MKVLNLDKFAKQGRQLSLGGVLYPIQEMTVSNFIATTKAAEALVDASVVEQVEATVEMVMRSVPTIQREALTGLDLEVLQVIVAFIRGDELESGLVEDAEKK